MRGVKNIAYDSRQVKKGSCFVAIRGEHANGHNFINDAVKNGATVIVSDHPVVLPKGVENIVVGDTQLELAEMSSEFFGHPSRQMRVIGITGTNGKTTITYLIESVLAGVGRNVGVIGTVNWRYDKKIFSAPNTTPMSYDLQKLLSEMRDAGVTDVVMEVSSHGLDQGRVACVDFDAAIFTNLTQDHLDYHKDMDAYYEAKARLFCELLPASSKPKKIAVTNADDEYGRKMSTKFSKSNKSTKFAGLTYGFSDGADIRCKTLESTVHGNKMEVATPWGNLNISSSLKGRFNALNIAATVSVLGGLGIPLEAIKKGIEDLKSVPGRLEDVPNNKGFSVFVDYAHTPDALQNVIETIKNISAGRLITVFGCGGDRDKTKRSQMGRIAVSLSDATIVTSDNPRTEDPAKIIEDILTGVKKVGGEFIVEPDRAKAIGRAISMAKKGDVVLIAGKGHETYQIVGKDVRHFDDREEVHKLC